MSRPEITIHKTIVMEEKTNYVKRSQRDYSMSLKLQIVSEIEKGFTTVTQARKQYSIQSHATVLNCLRKFGNSNK